MAINKNLVALIASILIGVIGAFGLKKFVDTKLAAQTDGDTAAYVVATTDIAQGAKISPENVSKRDIPLKWANSNAVKVDNYNAVDGAVTVAALKKGDVITYQVVDSNKAKQIAQLIPVGRRAITIPVDDESSISSMLKPADMIDLYLTIQSSEHPITVPLMEGVKILATGNIMSDRQAGTDTYNSSSSFTTITLDVSNADAKNIISASNMGKITAVLRNPNDQSQSVSHAVGGTGLNPPTPSHKWIPRQSTSNLTKQLGGVRIAYGNKPEDRG